MRVVAAGGGVHLKFFGGCQSKNLRICGANRKIFTRKKIFSSTPPTAATKAHIFLQNSRKKNIKKTLFNS